MPQAGPSIRRISSVHGKCDTSQVALSLPFTQSPRVWLTTLKVYMPFPEIQANINELDFLLRINEMGFVRCESVITASISEQHSDWTLEID